MDLNNKELLKDSNGPKFWPFSAVVNAEVRVLSLKERHDRSNGPHYQAYIECVSSDNPETPPGLYSIPFYVRSQKETQRGAAERDLRGFLCAMAGKEYLDASFNANEALKDCTEAKDELGVKVGVVQQQRGEGHPRRDYHPVE